MHHGTILIKHFYALALEEAKDTDTEVDIDDYRYIGPRPDSRETAILMLADATEAVSRLENTNSRTSIEKAVDAIIVDRIVDGQLSDTPLTLHDLELIKEALVKNIIGMSHKRIRYNTIETEKNE